MDGIWTSLKKAASRALAGLGLVSVAACASAQPAQPRLAGPKPALWKVADKDSIIYLFGTIHLLPKELQWRTPVLDAAIAASDTLYLETDLGSDVMASAQTMMKLGVSPGLPPIMQRVPAEKREAFRKAVAEAGIPEQALDRMETWAAALTLLTLNFRKMGLDPEAGVERGLASSYKGTKKPVRGLETVEQQFGYFDSLSEPAQRALLVSMIDDPMQAQSDFQAMLDAWKSGDTDAIARTFDGELELSPELREVLMKKRNAAWADWVAKRLDQPGTVMVAVGAGHLAGKDSVQRLLQARGLKATRVQ
jgi:uncharacterized protein YbaP (TraB family)